MKNALNTLIIHTTKHRFATYILLAVSMLWSLQANLQAKEAEHYVPENYVWTSQSHNSSESMPCGGHDVGLNVWVENGDVLMYISRSGMFDENNTLLKAGRLRLHLSSSPFDEAKGAFSQTLCLYDGSMLIKGKDTEIRIWVDVQSPVVYAQLKSNKAVEAVLSYESWRYKDTPVTKAQCQQFSYKWVLPKDCATYKDSIWARGSSLTVQHQNREQTVFDFTVEREKLGDIKGQLPNPIGGLRFGGTLQAPGFQYAGTAEGVYASTAYRAWQFKASRVKNSTITFSMFEGNEHTVIAPAKISRKRSTQWWNDFWQRSFIVIEASDDAKAQQQARNITRNYNLFRYMLGCNAYGKWPTKFNGGLFTFDPVYVDKARNFTPDYRCWGGGTMTAQNQRLVYWPMLKNGDFDMMQAQFDTYLRMLPAAMARTEYYWGHEGASYTEQIENFGLPNPAEYGKHKEGDDMGTERNAWLEYQWDTSLEFCSMILLAHRYAGVNIDKYKEMIRQCLIFFDLHYQYLAKQRGVKALDGNGKLILYPSSGCETYKMAYNPSSVIAALQTVIAQCQGIVELDSTLKNRIPDIPLHTINGHTCIAPALAWARIQNVETPQLYPVFPWRIYGVGREHLDIARNTYLYDAHALSMRSAKGWKQDNIWAACLGLTNEAKKLCIAKWADGPFRFPVFWEQGYDWAPDCNRGGSAMIGLQEMLLQEAPDGSLLLCPAWPKEWNVRFRLHATGNRIVEGSCKNGQITHHVVQK